LEEHGSSRSTRSSRLARLARQSRTCRVESSRVEPSGIWAKFSTCPVPAIWHSFDGSLKRASPKIMPSNPLYHHLSLSCCGDISSDWIVIIIDRTTVSEFAHLYQGGNDTEIAVRLGAAAVAQYTGISNNVLRQTETPCTGWVTKSQLLIRTCRNSQMRLDLRSSNLSVNGAPKH